MSSGTLNISKSKVPEPVEGPTNYWLLFLSILLDEVGVVW